MKQPEAKSGSVEGEIRETALRTSVIKSITKYEFLSAIYNNKSKINFKK